MSEYKYILNTEEKQGSMKILSKTVYVDGEFYGGLNFDFYIKDSLELLNLLGNKPDNGSIKSEKHFISQYGNKDTFKFFDNRLTKVYKTNKNSDTYTISFKLNNEMLCELIDYIMEKYNAYITTEAERNQNETQLSNELEDTKSNNKRSTDIQQQKSTTKVMDTKVKSQEELKDFNEFNSVMEIDTYLRTNNNAAAFIKWLQDNKLITLNHTYAPQELAKKPVEELNKLRQEYLNK